MRREKGVEVIVGLPLVASLQWIRIHFSSPSAERLEVDSNPLERESLLLSRSHLKGLSWESGPNARATRYFPVDKHEQVCLPDARHADPEGVRSRRFGEVTTT
ncbi:hypothetical protein GCM10009589_33510 [Arthrobacter pascens]